MFTTIQRFEWNGFKSLHPPVQRYGYFSHDYNYIGRGRSCELDTHRFTGQTYDRSAFSDVGNAFLLRQYSITVHEVSTDRQ